MHVAIIMDGNGRWAERRGLARSAGHRAGARVVRDIVETAARSGIDTLTLYAFSSANWSRPTQEVATLMWLLKWHLQSEIARFLESGIRLSVIGRRDRLDRELVEIVNHAEELTSPGQRLTLQLAIDYSARDVIARAGRLADTAGAIRGDAESAVDFEERIAAAMHSTPQRASVDLLIRTGGERRLSDFLLWECAYAELVFLDTCWPDFNGRALRHSLQEFRGRERRFGGLPGLAPMGRVAGGA